MAGKKNHELKYDERINELKNMKPKPGFIIKMLYRKDEK